MKRSCQETSYRDLVQRPGEEIRDLLPELERDLTLRSLTEIFCGDSYRHLVQIALQRDLAQQLLHRTCQGDLAHDLL